MDTDTHLNEIDEEVTTGSFAARHRELFCVTPLSKYLALALFVLLPFIGGYIGYTFAPEKVVEVETKTDYVAPDEWALPDNALNQTETKGAYLYQLRPGDRVEEGKKYWADMDLGENVPEDLERVHIELSDESTWRGEKIEQPESLKYLGAGLLGDEINLYGSVPCSAKLLKSQIDQNSGVTILVFESDWPYLGYAGKVYMLPSEYGLPCSLKNLPGLDIADLTYVGSGASGGEYLHDSNSVYFVPRWSVYDLVVLPDVAPTNFSTKVFTYPGIEGVRKEGTISFGVSVSRIFYGGTELIGLDANSVQFDPHGRTVYDGDTLWRPINGCDGVSEYIQGEIGKLGTYPEGGC